MNFSMTELNGGCDLFTYSGEISGDALLTKKAIQQINADEIRDCMILFEDSLKDY